MAKHSILYGAALAAILLTLPGCSSVREEFDLSRSSPDDFAVVSRAPLEMPPDYNLRPPRPGSPRPQEASAAKSAQTELLGENAQVQAAVPGVTPGEAALLGRTPAARVNPQIRTIVDRETARLNEENLSGADKVRKMIGQDVEPDADTVDPVSEAQRLEAARRQQGGR